MALSDGSSPLSGIRSFDPAIEEAKAPSLCIAIIGATGDHARRKIFPALFALYYSGVLPEVRHLMYSSVTSLTISDDTCEALFSPCYVYHTIAPLVIFVMADTYRVNFNWSTSSVQLLP